MSALLSALFESTKKAVEPVLYRCLTNPDVPPPLQEAMMGSIQNGGKRLRPALTRACANLFDISPPQANQVAAAIEVVHCYSLIHDDLPAMDNADMRRGQPSCWRQFGEATAILAGDSLLPLAFQILADEATHPSPSVRLSLIQALSLDAGAAGMAGGQMLDLSPHLIESIEQATTMQNLKTGCLMAFSCEAGAILAQAPREDRQRFRHFGFLFGLAYQIRDDLLDSEGTPEDLGKPVGMDTNKRSLVALLGASKSKQYLTSLQDQMSRLIAPYEQPLCEDLIAWATTRKG